MKENRVLIIGASGRVGREIFKIFKQSSNLNNYELHGTYFKNGSTNLHHLDLSRKDQIKEIFEKINPTIVIHTAGLIYPTECEINKDLAWKINVIGTKNIIEYCIKYNSKFVYISTDYVFDGNSGPYTENAQTNPLNYYGKTKLESEKLASSINDHLIIRTAWVNDIHNESKCFVMQVINSLKNNKKFTVYSDQYGHPTLSSNLAEMVIELIIKNQKGIFHATGLTYVDRFNFALKIAKTFSLNSSLLEKSIKTESHDSTIRPLRVNLDLSKIQSILDTKILNLDEQLVVMKNIFDEIS